MNLSNFMFSAAKLVGNTLYFSNEPFNGLFKMDIETMQPKFITFFPEEKIGQRRLHSKGFIYKEKIVFFPWCGTHIHLYNRVTGKMETLKITKEQEKMPLWMNIYQEGQFLWIFPINFEKPLLKLDLETLQFAEIKGFNQWCKKELTTKLNRVFMSIDVEDKNVWMAVLRGNEIVQYNLETNSLRKYTTNMSDLLCIIKAADGFYVGTTKSNIYKWCPKKGIIETYKCNDFAEEGKWGITALVTLEDDIYAIPSRYEYILKLDRNNKEFVKAYDYPKEFKFKYQNMFKFFTYDKYEKQLMLFPINSNGLLFLDDKNQKLISKIIKREIINYEKEPYKSYFDEMVRGEIMFEREEIPLKVFLDNLDILNKPCSKSENIGKNIFRVVSQSNEF